MRSLSADLQTAQAAVERTAISQVTIRDLRLLFSTTFDGNVSTTALGDLDWSNSVMGASCEDSDGHIHQCIAMDDGGTSKLYYREVTDLTTWDSVSWDVIDPSGIVQYLRPLDNSRCGIYVDPGTVRVFYVDGITKLIMYIDYTDSWDSGGTSTGGGGSSVISCGLAPVTIDTVYAYIDLNGVAGCRLRRGHLSGSWSWIEGPHIFTGKGRASLHASTFISAVLFNGIEYIVVADHDDGRAVLIQYHNGVWSDPVSILPMDIVSDPSDTTVPSSQFKPYALSVVNSQLFLTGRLIRPGSANYDFDLEVLLRGDGEHWTLDRHHALWEYDTDEYVGARCYLVGDYLYLVACQKVARATATNLVGVDASGKKTTLTSDILQWDCGFPGVNAAASLSLQIGNAADYDADGNIRQGAELTLEAGWDDNDGHSGYVTLGKFGLDSIQTGEAYQEDSLAISARSLAMKKLLDWRASQAYDYFSQCKIFEPFDDWGGFTEWFVGWNIEDGILQSTELDATADDSPEIAIDTTDWTTLDGVLVKTKFKFTGSGDRAAAILLNATDGDYKSVIQAQTSAADISLYNMREGSWETPAAAISEGITWEDDTWYDLAVLYAAGLFRAFYKLSSASGWTEVAGEFPYTWNKSYPAIEAEIYDTDSEEVQDKGDEGDRYAADKGYVGLRAWASVSVTNLVQDLWNPDMGSDEDEETVVVGTVDGFPNNGVIKVDDEIIIYSALHTGDEATTLAQDQDARDEKEFEVVDARGFPGHGVILVNSEAIEYEGYAFQEEEEEDDYYDFHVFERAAGTTVAATHDAGDDVRLDGGEIRDCTTFFQVPYISETADDGGTVEYLLDASIPWGEITIDGMRLEITQVPAETGNAAPAYEGTADAYNCGADKDQIHEEAASWAADEWETRAWKVMLRHGDWRRWSWIHHNGGSTLYLLDEKGGEWPGVGRWAGDCPIGDHGFEIWAELSERVFTAERSKGWSADQWNGYELVITSGISKGFRSVIIDTLPNTTNKANYLILTDALADADKDTTYEIWATGAYEDEVREIDHVDGDKIYPTEDFTQAPDSNVAYIIRGRGAYSTTPTSHAEGTTVYWYETAPVQFEHLEVYSLGRDYSVDWLLRDICYRAGATDFVATTQASGSGMPSIAASKYTDIPISLATTTRKNTEIEIDLTMPDDGYAAFGFVFRSSTVITAGTHSLPPADENAYELSIWDRDGSPHIDFNDNEGERTILERADIDFDISGPHTWRITVWEDFFSVWCDNRLVWSFHDEAHQAAGYMGLRFYNHGVSGGAIEYTYSYSIPELYEREPWFGYISGMNGQQAVQDLIRQRRVWWLERSDASLEFSRFYSRDDLGTYEDLHEISKNLDDRSIASVVLVTSEEYAFYVHPETLEAYGYRFLEVSNPDLNSEEECYDDSVIIQRLSREQSEQRGYTTERARLEAEPEDYFGYDDGGGEVDYIVNDITLGYGPARLSQRVGARLHAT